MAYRRFEVVGVEEVPAHKEHRGEEEVQGVVVEKREEAEAVD
jgi:hypothetical protein